MADIGNITLSYKTKVAIATTALAAFGAAYDIVSGANPQMKAELATWEDGRTFAIGVLEKGPAITFVKINGRVKKLGAGIVDKPDLVIYFKNIDAALLTFTGQMNPKIASVQHRTVVHGRIDHAMEAMRTMDIVIKFLMPGFLLKSMYGRKIPLTPEEALLKARVYAGLVPKMIF